jgi:hypothetical protein
VFPVCGRPFFEGDRQDCPYQEPNRHRAVGVRPLPWSDQRSGRPARRHAASSPGECCEGWTRQIGVPGQWGRAPPWRTSRQDVCADRCQPVGKACEETDGIENDGSENCQQPVPHGHAFVVSGRGWKPTSPCCHNPHISLLFIPYRTPGLGPSRVRKVAIERARRSMYITGPALTDNGLHLGTSGPARKKALRRPRS